MPALSANPNPAKMATKENNGGIAVTPVTTSSCFDDVVLENNGKVIHTAVGSPIVARVMIDNKSVFGGEENGGLIFPEMQYCRDSAMSIAKILEIMAKEGKTLSELIDKIPKYEVFKTKMPCPNDKKEIVMKTLAKFVKCESGATAIEYGLIAALIGVAIITVVNNAGTEIKGTFSDVEAGLKKRPSA